MTIAFDLAWSVGARTLRSTLDTPASRVAIVGPSGIGKTSLLGAVVGVRPSRGAITIGGTRIDTVSVEERAIGWAPQDGALFPHLDVHGNLAFGTNEKPIDRIAALVGLGAILGRSDANLSGGERQRVAIGRALARRGARLFVFDEPLSALDRGSRRELATAIERERARVGARLLLASHDEMDLAALADEVYEMREDGALTRRPSKE